MVDLIDANNDDTKTHRSATGLLVLFVVIAMFGIELSNTVRLMSNPERPKKFPLSYVSKGVWSFWAFIRPLDTDSTDFSSSLMPTHRAFHGDPNLYKDFRLEGISFLYPPTAVIELFPFAYMGTIPNLSIAFRAWDLIGRVSVLATIGIALWFLRPLLSRKKHWVIAILLLGAFFPLRWVIMCVNVQSLITLLMALVILTHATNRNLLAGILFGLAACLKPYMVLLLFFAVFRKNWRFVIGAMATAGLLIAASVCVVGIAPWKTYLFNVLPAVGVGYGYLPNQSINGLFHRWLGHATDMQVAPKSPIVSAATTVSSIIFLVLSVFPRTVGKGRNNQGQAEMIRAGDGFGVISQDVLVRAIDISIAILAVTLASPIVWDHYYAWCIVPFSICLVIDKAVGLSWLFRGVLGCGYVLLGTCFLSVKGVHSGPLTLLHSTYFFGAILLIGAAWYAQFRGALRNDL